jgi:hypothetical protein
VFTVSRESFSMDIRRMALAFLTLIFASVPALGKADTFAAGAALAWSFRQEYPSRLHRRFQPEVLFFTYLPISSEFSARGGIRGFYSWQSPDMPASLRLDEKDGGVLLDLGLTMDWYVVPSLSGGWGNMWRKTTLNTSAPLQVAGSRISGTTEFSFWSVQAGVGLPVLPSVLVEPFFRYVRATDDWRLKSVIGLETTASFF